MTPTEQETSHLYKRIDLFEHIFSLMLLINEEERFLSSVMTLCNELASRFQFFRVALGFNEGKYVRVQGISHIENFEPKMGAIQELESAMEEALDQNEEIIIPIPDDKWKVVVRSHENYSRKYGSVHIVSIPLRIKEEPVAILTCERSNPLSFDEIRCLRMICDQVIRRLFDLKEIDKWFGARLSGWLRNKLAIIFGIEHTFAKLMTLICSGLILFIIFGKNDYKIKAPFILKTDNIAYVQAPFDGYISKVETKIGDIVDKNDLLLELDTRDLRLKEAEIVADIHQFSRAEEKARSQDHLADMKIAQARLKRSQLELKRVQYFLEQARVKAPFSGIVVQGERQKLLGAPVRQGDIMYKIAEMNEYYVQLDVDEDDIHEIKKDLSGEIAFLSRPDIKFPIKINQISYTAQVKEKKNIFEVRAVINEKNQLWWRPGMSGIGKIDIEQRPIIWILSHRTIDFFRLYFWW